MRLLSLIVCIIFGSSFLVSQNKMYSAYSTFMPYKAKNIYPQIIETDLNGKILRDLTSNDTLNLDNWGNIPTSEIIFSNFDDVIVSVFDGSGYGYQNSIVTYDLNLNEVISYYAFEPIYQPVGNIIESDDGCIYGLCHFSDGIPPPDFYLYRYSPNLNLIDKYIRLDSLFTPSTGSIYYDEYNNSLIYGPDGNVYGLSNSGGNNNLGLIYMYDILNDTLIKKLDLNYSFQPKGNLFYTKSGRIFYTGVNKIYEYDPIVNSLYTIYQTSLPEIPFHLTEGLNNDFYGYLDKRYLLKVDLSSNSDTIIFDSYSIPHSWYDIYSDYFFSGYPSFSSTGSVLGFISIRTDDEMGFTSTKIYSLENIFGNYYSFEIKDEYLPIGEPYGITKLLEKCNPETVYDKIIILSTDSALLQGYYQSLDGNYIDTFNNSCGNDSIVITKLLVTDSYNVDTVYSCEGDTVYFGQESILNEGLYHTNYNGITGDSISAIQIIHNPTYKFDLEFSICDWDSIFFKNQYISVGYHQILYTTSDGCDSIFNLNISDKYPDFEIYEDNTSTYFVGRQNGFSCGTPYLNSNYEWIVSPSDYILNDNFAPNNIACDIWFYDAVEFTVSAIEHNECGSDTISIFIYPHFIFEIEEDETVKHFSISPNPGKSFVNIVSEVPIKIETIKIYDASGMIIQQLETTSQIDISKLESGLYIIKIVTPNGNEVHKIIKT